MHKNDHQLRDYDSVLDEEFGKIGTPERAKAEEEAYSFYTSQLICDARKQAGVTQAELAKRIHSSKSYISRLEHGEFTPSAGLLFQILNALGFEFILKKQSSPFAV
ncbi:MAG: helix-turn-helix transcriptional regulator [Muribaculaceae bacterium]|nr:helix-turn-helix transcriptional regulator [Muribaculaceae bacterium]